jgi:ankyrin repeat protein
MSRVTSKRKWAALGLALALATVPVAATGQGTSPNASEGEAFLEALRKNDASKAIELIKEPGSRVANYRGYKGETALTIATRKRELDWLVFLLQKDADPNLGDGQGDTALMIAARTGFEEAASILLRVGAKVDATNRRGETALHGAVQQRQPRLVELLLRAGANPDKTDHVSGYSARDYAKRDTRNPQLLKMMDTIKSEKKAVSGPVIR